MRHAASLVTLLVLGGCGTPFTWETPVDYVQLYPGVKHDYQLRVQYRVRGNPDSHNPLALLVPRYVDYMWSDWITLYGSGEILSAVEGQKSCCPDGTRFGCSEYLTRGEVRITKARAQVALEILERGGWKPYKFNGDYRLERPSLDPLAEATKQKANCYVVDTPSNSTPHTDARDVPPPAEAAGARAGGRER